MTYYNYNPYILYQLKHNILYYKDGGLIIKGKIGIKDLKKIKSKARGVYRAFENTAIGKKAAELIKADSYYVRLLRDYSKEYNNLSINDFINSVNGEYNNVNSVKESLNELLNHKNSRISSIARNIYNEIYAKELMAKAISSYKRGNIDEGREILDKIRDIRNTNPEYLNEFEEELSRVYTTTPSVNNIIAEESAAKELVVRTKKQEATRRALETRKKNLEKKNYLNELNSEFETVFNSGDPAKVWSFRNKHSYDEFFKGSDADKLSSEMINDYHDTYYTNKIQNSEDVDLLHEYLMIYPEGEHAKEVKKRINKLTESQQERNYINLLISDLLKNLEKANELIEQLNKEREETLDAMKKKSGPLAAIRRHPWRTTLIGAGLTLGGGTIVGGLYLLCRGVGKVNQAGWELTTGKTQEPDTVNQSNVLPIENQTDTVTPKISITEQAIREKLAKSQNANQDQ